MIGQGALWWLACLAYFSRVCLFVWVSVVCLGSERSCLFIFCFWFVCWHRVSGSQVTQAGLKHPIQLGMTLNFWSFYFQLQSAGWGSWTVYPALIVIIDILHWAPPTLVAWVGLDITGPLFMPVRQKRLFKVVLGSQGCKEGPFTLVILPGLASQIGLSVPLPESKHAVIYYRNLAHFLSCSWSGGESPNILPSACLGLWIILLSSFSTWSNL